MTSEKAFAAHTRIDYHIANHAGPWALFSPLSNSWSVPGGGIARYRLTADNELQIDAVIKAPGSSVNGVTIAVFPAGFRPPFTRGVACGTDTANNAAGASSPLMTITAGGVMQSGGVGANGIVYIQARVALDS